MGKVPSSDAKEKPSSSRKKSVWEDPRVVIAIIGTIGSIVTVVIANLPAIMSTLKNTPTPLVAPPTATFVPALSPAPSLTPSVTPSATLTPLLPLETPTLTPKPTSTGTMPPLYALSSFSCLDGWQVVSSDASFAATPLAVGTCNFSRVPELGIATAGDRLYWAVSSFRPLGIYGIAAPLPLEGGTLNLTVSSVSVLGGEFWVAFAHDPLPTGNALIFALQPQSGEVRLYHDNPNEVFSRLTWSKLQLGTEWVPNAPYIYRMSVKIEGNNVGAHINSVKLPDLAVNLPRYLFIGFRKKSTLDVLDLNLRLFDLKFSP